LQQVVTIGSATSNVQKQIEFGWRQYLVQRRHDSKAIRSTVRGAG
jgi:hypothetical protein